MYCPCKVEHEGGTDENNRNTDESQSENDSLLIKLYKEQDYKEFNEFKEDYSIFDLKK